MSVSHASPWYKGQLSWTDVDDNRIWNPVPMFLVEVSDNDATEEMGAFYWTPTVWKWMFLTFVWYFDQSWKTWDSTKFLCCRCYWWPCWKVASSLISQGFVQHWSHNFACSHGRGGGPHSGLCWTDGFETKQKWKTYPIVMDVTISGTTWIIPKLPLDPLMPRPGTFESFEPWGVIPAGEGHVKRCREGSGSVSRYSCDLFMQWCPVISVIQTAKDYAHYVHVYEMIIVYYYYLIYIW